jgi:hypothetical protein
MDFRYRWKNGAPPNRDRAATEETLLDEGQFETSEDQRIAETMARQHLNVPLQADDAGLSPSSREISEERDGKKL